MPSIRASYPIKADVDIVMRVLSADELGPQSAVTGVWERQEARWKDWARQWFSAAAEDGGAIAAIAATGVFLPGPGMGG